MPYWKQQMPEGRRFKKGERPSNWRPIGSEKLWTNGYVYIKTASGKWQLKQRVIWEEANGPLPNDCRVIFIDGDQGNFSLDNLKIARMRIGEEREGSDGYLQVCIALNKGRNKWRRKQLLVWEEANGPLPKGYTVIFLDGDISNCKLENLLMVPKNKKHWRLTDVYGHNMRPMLQELERLKSTCELLRRAFAARFGRRDRSNAVEAREDGNG